MGSMSGAEQPGSQTRGQGLVAGVLTRVDSTLNVFGAGNVFNIIVMDSGASIIKSEGAVPKRRTLQREEKFRAINYGYRPFGRSRMHSEIAAVWSVGETHSSYCHHRKY